MMMIIIIGCTSFGVRKKIKFPAFLRLLDRRGVRRSCLRSSNLYWVRLFAFFFPLYILGGIVRAKTTTSTENKFLISEAFAQYDKYKFSPLFKEDAKVTFLPTYLVVPSSLHTLSRHSTSNVYQCSRTPIPGTKGGRRRKKNGDV